MAESKRPVEWDLKDGVWTATYMGAIITGPDREYIESQLEAICCFVEGDEVPMPDFNIEIELPKQH